MQEERGVHLSDNDLLAVAFGALIDGGSSEERSGRAKFQIAIDLCPQCEHGWQKGAGRRFAMEKADVERAKCDAQYIGSLDGDPARAAQDVPPRVRRFVFRRDGGKCRAPGCRSTTNLEIHHLKARACGGSHAPNNLILMCDGCHATHHRGLLEIRGTADNLVVERRHRFDRASHGAHVGVDDEVRADVGADDFYRAHDRVVDVDRALNGAGADPDAHVSEVRADVGVDRGALNDADAAPDAHVGVDDEVRADVGVDRVDVVACGAGADTRADVGVVDAAHVGVDSIDRTGADNRGHARVPAMSPEPRFMSKLDRATIRTQALDALVRLGFKRHEARAAVDAAEADCGVSVQTLESFLRIALSNVPRPRTG